MMFNEWLITLFFLFGAITAIYLYVTTGRQNWLGIVILTPLVLATSWLTYNAIRMVLEYHKFGAVYFWQQGEVQVGGTLRGIVDMRAKVSAANQLRAELICVKVYWRRPGGGKDMVSDMIELDHWRTTRQFPIMGNAQRLEVAIAIDVPANRKPTDVPEYPANRLFVPEGPPPGGVYGRDYYRWDLRITAAMPGTDLERTFRVRILPADTSAANELPANQPQVPV